MQLSRSPADSVVTQPVTITKVDPAWSGSNGDAVGFLTYSDQPTGAKPLAIYKSGLQLMAERCCRDHLPVHLEIATPAISGRSYVRAIALAQVRETPPEFQRPGWRLGADGNLIKCLPHYWDVHGRVLKCRHCGWLKRAER